MLKLYNDFKASPLSMKIAFPTLLLLSVLVVASCSVIGPSPDFVARQKQNADELFPLVQTLIQEANESTWYKVLGVDSASAIDIEDYKESLNMRLKSWKYLIDKENEIVKGLANE